LKRIKNSLRVKLVGRSFLKSVLIIAGGTALSQVIMAASSPIVSRLYSPEEIGLWSVYSSVLGMISVLATMKLELAIPIADKDETALNVVFLSSLTALGASVLVLVLSLALASPIASMLNAEPLIPYMWLLCIGTLGIGLYNTFVHWAIRKKLYADITRTKISQGVTKVLVQVASGFLKFGPLGLILGEIAGQASGIKLLAKPILKSQTFKVISPTAIKLVALRYWKFPLISSWSALLNAVSYHIPVLLLSAGYGSGVAGAFGFSHRIISIPVSLIGVSIAQVFYSEGASLSKEEPEELLILTKRTVIRLFAFSLPFAVLLILFAPSAFELIFGEAWREAGVYARILAAMLTIRLAVSPISQTLSIIESQGTQLLLDLLRLCIVVAAIAIPTLLEMSALQAVASYSFGMIVVYLIVYMVIIRVLKKKVTVLSSLKQ